jgi:hypothetical protein
LGIKLLLAFCGFVIFYPLLFLSERYFPLPLPGGLGTDEICGVMGGYLFWNIGTAIERRRVNKRLNKPKAPVPLDPVMDSPPKSPLL